MAVGRAQRFELLKPRVVQLFGASRTRIVFALLELTEMAWHDCYGEVTPPAEVMDDILLCSQGDIEKLIRAANSAVRDYRNLRLRAQSLSGAGPE